MDQQDPATRADRFVCDAYTLYGVTPILIRCHGTFPVPKGWRLAWRGKVPAGRMVEAAQLRRSKKKPRASAGLGSDSQDGCDQKPTGPMLVPSARMAGLFF